ncbi:hypothetical protein KSK37_01605 [Kaistella sp. DKR-2]|uniref:hypothetical protein n=1 Tax=Kaistella soli TaxID=2849654 RepID=UPI001C2663D4|nr:hypothetical protein [Kaistella soli]MBU8881771.1 hypothetical protein [Kaistella soli]
MKNILFLTFLFFSSLLFSQASGEAIAEGHYKRQVSNAAYEKALNEMQTSAKRSADEKLKQLNEKFELNFAQNKKFKSKLSLLQQKKMKIQSEIMESNSETEKHKLDEKISTFNLEIEKLNEKIKANESELVVLQESYNKIIK